MTTALPPPIARAIDAIRQRHEPVIVEPEGYPLLTQYGVSCPRSLVVAGPDEVAGLDLSAWPGERVVVKIASAEILHRSDVRGLAVAARDAAEIAACIGDLQRRLDPSRRARYTVNEFVPHESAPGHQWLVGLRWTDDFGPVVVVAPGGIHAEFWARTLPPADALAMFGVEDTTREAVEARLRRLPLIRLVTEPQRGQPAVTPLSAIAGVVSSLQALGRALVPHELRELEINPLAITGRGPVALDVLARVDPLSRQPWPARPLGKLASLYVPRSAAIVGVSEKGLNVGRIILRNLLREGFPRDRIYVVKPGAERIDDCRCVPDLAALPERVDMAVLAIGAAQVPATLTEIVERAAAESVIVIPGGLEEKAGTEQIVARMRESLLAARSTAWGGPVVNGGNCLGIRSRPGRYDTMFIPAAKLPSPETPESPLAFVSQSGAFAIARLSRVATLNPRYVVTAGNQMDLTMADHLEALAGDPAIKVFALYVEGFRPLDGRRVVDLARHLTAQGRRVVLYRAGRTAAGAQASASHTASIAGDYAVTRELAQQAGILLAESIDAFEDLVQLCVALADRRASGPNIGAVSNAGFECVALADALGRFSLARFSAATEQGLAALLGSAKIDGLVDVHNPMDLTPMAGDATYDAVVRVVADDPGVDVVVVGCVPLTAQLQTLAPAAHHGEDATGADAVAARLARAFAGTTKPMVVAIDSGALYDAMAAVLQRAGVPVFRSVDRALRALDAWMGAGLDDR
jgi:acyl-CoA synthetase (NDP forming)